MQLLRQLLSTFIGNSGCGKYYHIGLYLHRRSSQQSVYSFYNQFTIFLINARNTSTYIVHSIFFDGATYKLFIVFTSGTNIHVEHIRLALMHFVLIKHGMFSRVHTADFRTIRDSFGRVTRTGTGHKYYFLRNLSVRRTTYFPQCRTGCRSQTLKLNT